MASTVPYRELANAAAIIADTVYATMVTVDKHGPPRTRVLIVVWELQHETPTGWLATHKTPVKTAHLAHNRHVSTSYWSPTQNVFTIDSAAQWDSGDDVAEKVWNLHRSGSPPGNGYNPEHYWTGPDDPSFQVLRLTPWRMQVLTQRELARGLPYRQARFQLPSAQTA
jgi:general stress protein 26